MKKKSQVKFGESIGIIIIVYFVIVTGLVWYNSVTTKSLNELNEEDQKNRAFEKYYFLVNNNLLHVSQRGFIDKEFDYHSLKTMQKFTQNSTGSKGEDYMDSYLGNSFIEVHLYDKSLSNIQNITLYNNTPKSNIKMTETFTTLIPVRDFANQTTYIGVLKLTDFIT